VGGEAGASTDRDLVERVRAGDTAAFASLYDAHVGAVRRAISDRVRDPDALADAAQDTFVRALQNLDSLRAPESFRPWLLAIARHVAVDHHRSGARVKPLDDEAAAALPAPDGGPDVTAELAELAHLVQGCMATLSPRDATAVALVTHLGLAPSEVAAALGVSLNSAKVIVHRARRRLRNALALELIVRRPVLACDALLALLDTDPLVGATRHVATCDTCLGAARGEVNLYHLGPMTGTGS
jgi:RNA polymerase sigma factor (sigma-70 family)